MAATRRKVRDEDDAWELLDDWEESGLELGDFCERRGLNTRSLNCWRLNLGELDNEVEAPAPALRLVEVVGPRPARKAEYRLSVGDVVIEVDDDFRDDTLARLLRVAATC